jgi:hypothetical protein
MTILNLLRNFGVHVPRYVTVDGQIIATGVTATSTSVTGYSHTSHGAVTRLAAHTFHGGEEPTETTIDALGWWQDPHQIDRHRSAMAQAFPTFEQQPSLQGGAPTWTGTINTNRGRFTVSIVTRADNGLPYVVPLIPKRFGKTRSGRWARSPHLYDNGNLCVADQDDWDPTVHTAATVTAWAAHWYAAYTEWRMSDRWPTEGHIPRRGPA